LTWGGFDSRRVGCGPLQIKHPIESAKEAGKIISDRSAGAGPSPDTRSKK